MSEPRVILNGLAYVESPRWHDGRLWFAQWGEMLATIGLDRGAFARMLGGPDGQTLFMLAAEWRGFEEAEQAIADRTGQVLVADAPAPRTGWP